MRSGSTIERIYRIGLIYLKIPDICKQVPTPCFRTTISPPSGGVRQLPWYLGVPTLSELFENLFFRGLTMLLDLQILIQTGLARKESLIPYGFLIRNL